MSSICVSLAFIRLNPVPWLLITFGEDQCSLRLSRSSFQYFISSITFELRFQLDTIVVSISINFVL